MKKIDKNQTIEYKVYSILKSSILKNILKSGEKLNQEKIAKQLNVSRMPVRIAIKKLEKDGLVQNRPYKGTRVTSFSNDDVEEVYSIRLILESYALKLSIGSFNKEEIETLYSLHRKLKSSFGQETLKNIAILNRDFHMSMYGKCGNKRLINMINDLWYSLPLDIFWNFSEKAEESIKEHACILESIEKGNKKDACQKLIKHIKRSKKVMLKKFTKNLNN